MPNFSDDMWDSLRYSLPNDLFSRLYTKHGNVTRKKVYTVVDKIKVMWERQPYFKTLPSKAYLKTKEVKPKPYWRTNERW